MLAGAGGGHDTATLQAFSGEAAAVRPSCRSILHPVSLRLNAKRGIVGCLDAAGWVRIRDDP